MSDLPKGWVEATLDDLVTANGLVTDGDWVESKDQDPSGEVRLTQLADVGEGHFRNRSDRYMALQRAEELGCTFLQAGDVLIARMPDPLGRACIFPGLSQPAVTVVDVLVFRSGTDLVSPQWIMSAINATETRQKIIAQASGTTRQRISGGNLKRLPLPLPPLAEQKRIVAKLDALNTKSARARTELARIETLVSRYKQAVLSKAFSGELTREWREVASTTWPWRSELWGDCGETLNGRAFPSGDYCDSGVRLLRPGNLGASGDIFWNEKNTRFLPEKYVVEFPKHFIKGEAILINLTAQSLEDQFLARACLSSASDEFMLNQRIGLFRPRNMIPKFCLFALKSPRFRSFVDNGMNSGSLIQHVHTKQLEQYKFDVPDIEEQHEIVRRIEAAFARVDRLAKEAKRALELVGRLDEAILAKAFRGELVPQDENDEPAELLLARIRAEREAAPKGKRGRGMSEA